MDCLRDGISSWFWTLLFLAWSGTVLAVETPPALAGTAVVSAEQVRSLQSKGAFVVDARVAYEYVEEHIKGAVNIPYKEKSPKTVNFDPNLDQFEVSKLPPNKATQVIFYCNGPECWKSYKASKAAVHAGYVHVYWFRGGIPEWKSKGFPVE